MTPELREQYRLALIRILAAAGAVGMKLAAIKIALRALGFDAATDTDLANALDYLAGKDLAAQMDKTISPENARWKITAGGSDYAAKEGLA